MDPVISIPAIAIVSLAAGAYGMHKLGRSSSIPKAESSAVEGVVDGVAALLDTSAEDKVIAAANARKATKAATAQHLAQVLAAKAAPPQP